MTIHLRALPALVAARALRKDAAAARRTLDLVRKLLGSYDLALALLADLPVPAREAMVAALHKRLVATERLARSAQARLDEVSVFCDLLKGTPSPVAMVEVSVDLFEMLSPYLDDAMAPVLARISRRAGPGCTVETVGRYFPPPRPVLAA